MREQDWGVRRTKGSEYTLGGCCGHQVLIWCMTGGISTVDSFNDLRRSIEHLIKEYEWK